MVVLGFAAWHHSTYIQLPTSLMDVLTALVDLCFTLHVLTALVETIVLAEATQEAVQGKLHS